MHCNMIIMTVWPWNTHRHGSWKLHYESSRMGRHQRLCFWRGLVLCLWAQYPPEVPLARGELVPWQRRLTDGVHAHPWLPGGLGTGEWWACVTLGFETENTNLLTKGQSTYLYAWLLSIASSSVGISSKAFRTIGTALGQGAMTPPPSITDLVCQHGQAVLKPVGFNLATPMRC